MSQSAALDTPEVSPIYGLSHRRHPQRYPILAVRFCAEIPAVDDELAWTSDMLQSRGTAHPLNINQELSWQTSLAVDLTLTVRPHMLTAVVTSSASIRGSGSFAERGIAAWLSSTAADELARADS
eukprot:CAMPEP_0184734074 /NCGR_PEP_ID=MMETSP0314-20130426/59412_1 /TAXON_ID=38298 /ORGANISM="Rhodella maculata, Strain CCMP 736" /LENGTH=124 /DNA_ID=CAMNT_0027200977 /DNA_START=74 /DNA_END=448 /DNA_ORIENTATION=+